MDIKIYSPYDSELKNKYGKRYTDLIKTIKNNFHYFATENKNILTQNLSKFNSSMQRNSLETPYYLFTGQSIANIALAGNNEIIHNTEYNDIDVYCINYETHSVSNSADEKNEQEYTEIDEAYDILSVYNGEKINVKINKLFKNYLSFSDDIYMWDKITIETNLQFIHVRTILQEFCAKDLEYRYERSAYLILNNFDIKNVKIGFLTNTKMDQIVLIIHPEYIKNVLDNANMIELNRIDFAALIRGLKKSLNSEIVYNNNNDMDRIHREIFRNIIIGINKFNEVFEALSTVNFISAELHNIIHGDSDADKSSKKDSSTVFDSSFTDIPVSIESSENDINIYLSMYNKINLKMQPKITKRFIDIFYEANNKVGRMGNSLMNQFVTEISHLVFKLHNNVRYEKINLVIEDKLHDKHDAIANAIIDLFKTIHSNHSVKAYDFKRIIKYINSIVYNYAIAKQSRKDKIISLLKNINKFIDKDVLLTYMFVESLLYMIDIIIKDLDTYITLADDSIEELAYRIFYASSIHVFPHLAIKYTDDTNKIMKKIINDTKVLYDYVDQYIQQMKIGYLASRKMNQKIASIMCHNFKGIESIIEYQYLKVSDITSIMSNQFVLKDNLIIFKSSHFNDIRIRDITLELLALISNNPKIVNNTEVKRKLYKALSFVGFLRVFDIENGVLYALNDKAISTKHMDIGNFVQSILIEFKTEKIYLNNDANDKILNYSAIAKIVKHYKIKKMLSKGGNNV